MYSMYNVVKKEGRIDTTRDIEIHQTQTKNKEKYINQISQAKNSAKRNVLETRQRRKGKSMEGQERPS